MSTSIPEVQQTSITHAVFIDLDLDGNVYYISSAYAPVGIDGNVYTELGAYLGMSSLQDDLKTTNGDIQISLSGIPSEANYMNQVLGTQIKGGSVRIRRAFFDTQSQQPIANAVYERYRGVITNFAVDEDTDFITGKLVNTISISCASINTVLENKISGQRTNSSDRNKFYPDDISFDRVKDLQNTSFDFGKEYRGGTGYGGASNTSGINLTNVRF